VFYAFLIVVAIAGIGLYIFVILREVPGAAEERLGIYEDLPGNVNKWEPDEESAEGKAALERGERREVRLFFAEGSGKLLRQVRYKNVGSNEIERAEPDEIVKRKRVRS
jgi:hypothetical protein